MSVGKIRSKQQTLREGDYSLTGESSQGDKTLCVQVHGDASFSAQVSDRAINKGAFEGALCYFSVTAVISKFELHKKVYTLYLQHYNLQVDDNAVSIATILKSWLYGC